LGFWRNGPQRWDVDKLVEDRVLKTGSVCLQNGTPTYHTTHWRNTENHKMFIYAAKPEILYQQV